MRRLVAFDFLDKESGLRFLAQLPLWGFDVDSNETPDRGICYKDSDVVGRMLEEQYLIVYEDLGRDPENEQYNRGVQTLKKVANEFQ